MSLIIIAIFSCYFFPLRSFSPVSVPLRGIRRETPWDFSNVKVNGIIELFPSPCGALGVKLGQKNFVINQNDVFVPLRGARRETNADEVVTKNKDGNSFRPLAGC